MEHESGEMRTERSQEPLLLSPRGPQGPPVSLFLRFLSLNLA